MGICTPQIYPLSALGNGRGIFQIGISKEDISRTTKLEAENAELKAERDKYKLALEDECRKNGIYQAHLDQIGEHVKTAVKETRTALKGDE